MRAAYRALGKTAYRLYRWWLVEGPKIIWGAWQGISDIGSSAQNWKNGIETRSYAFVVSDTHAAMIMSPNKLCPSSERRRGVGRENKG